MSGMTPIKLLILDIDGVITDGTAAYTAEGEEQKSISFRDLDAVFEARRNGLLVGIVTGEDGPWADFLVERLGVELVRRGAKDKLAAIRDLAGSVDIDLSAVCYVGDAVRDAPALAAVGLGLAPSDASAEARRAATEVLSSPGGKGAVSEAVARALQIGRQAGEPETAGVGPRGSTTHRADRVRELVRESAAVHQAIADDLAPVIVETADLISGALAGGGKLIVFGNGGSASDAEHMAAELVGRFARERRPLAALALTANTSVITALANDYGHDEIFARQVDALARPGDVVVAISTSGRSPNVIAAARRARELGLTVIALTGADPSILAREADLTIAAPSRSTARIQEAHRVITHVVCELVESGLSTAGAGAGETGGADA